MTIMLQICWQLNGLANWWLLSDEPIYRQMGARFRNNSSREQLGQTLLFLVLLIGVIGLAWWVNRLLEQRKRQARTSPRWLFRELAQAHGLNRRETRLLWDYAASLELDNPALLFVLEQGLRRETVERQETEHTELLVELGQRLFRRPSSSGSAQRSEAVRSTATPPTTVP